MKQLIFLFALLLSAGATYAQNAERISDEEYATRKQTLSKFYGDDLSNHLEELTAPADDLPKIRWTTPITKEFFDYHNKTSKIQIPEPFIGQPVALVYMLMGETQTMPAAIKETLSDTAREYLEKYRDLIKIID